MFLSNGEPGQLRSIMASVGAARKVFRIMRVSETGVHIYPHISISMHM